MKKCTRCKKTKPKTDFNKNKNKKDKLQTMCRVCSREHSRDYYNNDKQNRRKIIYIQRAKIIKSNQNKILEYLQTHTCVICNEKDPICLEFDHLNPAKKYKAISKMIRSGYKWSNILKEIKKCQVLCANCHKRKTAKQFKWYKCLPSNC